MSLPVFRDRHPRLFRPADAPDYRFAPPRDPARKRILRNVVLDCEALARRRPWNRIPGRLDSPHPFHQLYITFYTAMQATALIEHYAFAWRITGDERWLSLARRWLLAASRWEHSDRIEEHFYTANRYMHAFAFALDLLAGTLTAREEDTATECLIRLMKRWWPDVDKNRHSPAGGHHAVVDNGHFGVAALHLLGKHSDAPEWVQAVIDRFRAAIMPFGCGRDGEPVDGPTFWAWENLWMLQFADALRNVTGMDLCREFPQRLARPLKWFKCQLAAPGRSVAAGDRQAWSATLLRLAQEAGDAELRAAALGDPQLGCLFRFGMGVKGSSAEALIACGPYAYGYCDPGFKPRARDSLPPSRKFTKAQYGESAVLRSAWTSPSLVASVSGYSGGVAHGFSNLEVTWAGNPVLTTIACEEARPVRCGNLPSVGGQNEIVALLGRLETNERFDRLSVSSIRLEHEYWLLRGEPPVLLVALRRKPRGVSLDGEGDQPFVRLDGTDYLQYLHERHFNPGQGRIAMRVRLQDEIDPSRPQILFNTGVGVSGLTGTQVNNFNLGFFGGPGLAFAVQSQRYAKVDVRIPPDMAKLMPGQWHAIAASWGGFNDPKGRPFIELELDGHRQRCDDVARFGELGHDTQHLRSRTTPRTFYICPNTLLAFGAALQMPGTGTRCDIAGIRLVCPNRLPLILDFAAGLGNETGSGLLLWKLHPTDFRGVRASRACLGAGARALELIPILPRDSSFACETVPYAPTGLAAGSLRNLVPGSERASTRLLVSAGNADVLVWALKPRSPRLRVGFHSGGFSLKMPGMRSRFDLTPGAKSILALSQSEGNRP